MGRNWVSECVDINLSRRVDFFILSGCFFLVFCFVYLISESLVFIISLNLNFLQYWQFTYQGGSCSVDSSR